MGHSERFAFGYLARTAPSARARATTRPRTKSQRVSGVRSKSLADRDWGSASIRSQSFIARRGFESFLNRDGDGDASPTEAFPPAAAENAEGLSGSAVRGSNKGRLGACR